MHMTLYQDTMYWRNPWKADTTGEMGSLPPLRSLCGFLCGMGRAGLRGNIAQTFSKAGVSLIAQKDTLEPRLSDERHADHTALLVDQRTREFVASAGSCCGVSVVCAL